MGNLSYSGGALHRPQCHLVNVHIYKNKSFDKLLRDSNENLKLTVDLNIQYLIRKELIRFNKIFQTKGSASILMNIHNGEILSMISLPDFDLNQRKNITTPFTAKKK